jgi:MOSC domain-containing protein YiiM
MVEGRIFQLNVSDGGVPKRARPQIWVGVSGVEGDRQATPEVHGGPDRAVLMFSLDQILALQAEGHPIYPGAVGENVTVVGLDWERVVPGVQLRLGNEVLLEVTRFASPCKTIAGAFTAGRYERISHKTYPGWARACARVLQEGHIRIGEPVVLMP